MSLEIKAIVTCNRCGTHAVTDGTLGDPFFAAVPADKRPKGWLAIDRSHHLCPACADAYSTRKAEMERELKGLAGIETIEVDI